MEKSNGFNDGLTILEGLVRFI